MDRVCHRDGGGDDRPPAVCLVERARRHARQRLGGQRVGADRQMGPMLFGRAEWDDDDGVLVAEFFNLGTGEVVPTVDIFHAVFLLPDGFLIPTAR